MSTGLWLALIAVTTALCTYLVQPLPTAAGWYVVALVPLSAASIAQAKTLARLPPDHIKRIPVYFSSITTLWLLAAGAIAVSVLSEFTAGMIGLRSLAPDITVAWVVFGLATALLVLVVMKLLNAPDSPLLKQLLPVTGRERVLFAGLSVTAGITEEIVFRGFLITALGFLFGNLWLGALLAAAFFAAMHAYQSWYGAVAAGILGFALSVPFIVSGSIIPSMVAHAGIDLIAGLWLIRRMQ